MNRFWPALFILFCWLFVALVPALRQSTVAAWQNWSAYTDQRGQKVTALPFVDVSPRTASWLKQSPDDKSLQIYAARENGYRSRSNFDYLEKQYPKEAFVVALQLDSMLTRLVSNRKIGPLSRRNFPTAASEEKLFPRAEWDKFIALARRGQSLEPRNSYFDWLVMYGLFATRRDEEALRVLLRSSSTNTFNPHSRERVQNSAQVMQRFYGSPIPPSWLLTVSKQPVPGVSTCLRRVTNWTMDSAYIARSRGQHAKALVVTMLLAQLTKNARREGYAISDSREGFLCERIALTSSALTPTEIDIDATLATYKSSSRTYYAYAREQGNEPATQMAAKEWADMQQWLGAGWLQHDWMATHAQTIQRTTFANRFQALLLKTLPLTLLFCLVSGILSARFRAPEDTRPLILQGALAAVVLSSLLLGHTALIAFFYDTKAFYEISFILATRSDLLDCAPSWVVLGVPIILLCLALQRARRWQNTATPGNQSVTTIAASHIQNGLPRIDFGRILSLILQITYFAAVAVLFIGFSLNMSVWANELSTDQSLLALYILLATLSPALIFIGLTWLSRPRRSETLRLSFHYIYQMTTGYILASSVLFILAAAFSYSLSSRFERDFEANIQKGSLKIARTELKLK